MPKDTKDLPPHAELLLNIVALYGEPRFEDQDMRDRWVRIWYNALVGFDADAYPLAGDLMFSQRKSNFRPVPAEVREYLLGAEDLRRLSRGEPLRPRPDNIPEAEPAPAPERRTGLM